MRGEEVAEFYQNFIALSKAVYPVTARSLRSCTTEQDARKWIFWRSRETAADRILNTYRLWGFAALIILVMVQAYWVMGTFLIASIPILSENDPNFAQAIEQMGAWEAKNWDDIPKEAESKELIEYHKKADLYAREVNYERLLDIWVSPGVWFAEWIDSHLKVEHLNNQANVFWRAGTVAKEVLNVLQSYVLPPLYGWVGATAYVLRRLISEINSRTYQEDSDTSYSLRIYLGILAGLAIGWFLEPGTKASGNVLQALSPLALAFLAGYSVELLFSAMDRLLEAFSAKAPSPKST